MVFTEEKQTEKNAWEELNDELREELEQSRQQMKEINLMLEQSQVEVNKLAQRNASITTHLQQIHNEFDSIPRNDIRMAYDAALDAQQRLFVMRGQLEKLQSDHTHLKSKISWMEQVMDVLHGGGRGSRGGGQSATADTLEMLIQAQESERQRLSRQMHDGPAQALSNFILQTEIAMRLFDIDQVKAREELVNLKSSATTAFQQVRDFIFALRPMMLDDLGLTPTLKKYVTAFKDQSGVDMRVNVTGTERRLESYLEVMIFRAVQELLTNAAQHSQANQVRVLLDVSETNVKISVEDNGSGFDLVEWEGGSGRGLKVIKDRVEMLGGVFELDSVLGRGTRVTFQVPAVKAAAIE